MAPVVASSSLVIRPRIHIKRLALVAQLDRAVDFESKGRRFESYQARHFSSIARHARVAELADAPDLGSGILTMWEFKSPLSYQERE